MKNSSTYAIVAQRSPWPLSIHGRQLALVAANRKAPTVIPSDWLQHELFLLVEQQIFAHISTVPVECVHLTPEPTRASTPHEGHSKHVGACESHTRVRQCERFNITQHSLAGLASKSCRFIVERDLPMRIVDFQKEAHVTGQNSTGGEPDAPAQLVVFTDYKTSPVAITVLRYLLEPREYRCVVFLIFRVIAMYLVASARLKDDNGVTGRLKHSGD